jgi:hypothetical protein
MRIKHEQALPDGCIQDRSSKRDAREGSLTVGCDGSPAAGHVILSCGWFGWRFSQRYAAVEFFQKNFSATAVPFFLKYS